MEPYKTYQELEAEIAKQGAEIEAAHREECRQIQVNWESWRDAVPQFGSETLRKLLRHHAAEDKCGVYGIGQALSMYREQIDGIINGAPMEPHIERQVRDLLADMCHAEDVDAYEIRRAGGPPSETARDIISKSGWQK